MCRATHAPICSANPKHLSLGPCAGRGYDVKENSVAVRKGPNRVGEADICHVTGYRKGLPECDRSSEKGLLTPPGTVREGAPEEGKLD